MWVGFLRSVVHKALTREDGQPGILCKLRIGERKLAQDEDTAARIVNGAGMHAVCTKAGGTFDGA